ncbi:MAG: PTS sugar transporter subunit IIA [Deltaproteobacteria bacterium]|jgi:PTS system nitrogen regulatory IIA component|nr:PTS sugar transporter subunit IIA [Deltaproteobacteria bacterium]
MDLKQFLTPEAIILDLTATTYPEALTTMCQLAARLLRRQLAEILEPVLERENLGPTAVGGGVAIPHGKVPGLSEVFLTLARIAPGAELAVDSPDGQPVKILTLVLSPMTPTSGHLRVLALLGRLWKTPKNLSLLLAAPDQETFYRLFLELAAIAA